MGTVKPTHSADDTLDTTMSSTTQPPTTTVNKSTATETTSVSVGNTSVSTEITNGTTTVVEESTQPQTSTSHDVIHIYVIGLIEGTLLLAVFIIIIIVFVSNIRRKHQLKKSTSKASYTNTNPVRTHDAECYCVINKTKADTTTEPSQTKKKPKWLQMKHSKAAETATKDDESKHCGKPELHGAESVHANIDPGPNLEYMNTSAINAEKRKVYHILEADANAPPENGIVLVQQDRRRGPTDKKGDTRKVNHILEIDPDAPPENDIVIVQEQHQRANGNNDKDGDSKVYHILEPDPDAPLEKDIVFVSIRDGGGRNAQQNAAAHEVESTSRKTSLHVYSVVHNNCTTLGDKKTGEIKPQPVLSQDLSNVYQEIDLTDNPDMTTSTNKSTPTKKKRKWMTWKSGKDAESSTKKDKQTRKKKTGKEKEKAGTPSHTGCLTQSATQVVSRSREATSVDQNNGNQGALTTDEETKQVYHVLEPDANAPQDDDVCIVPVQHRHYPSGRKHTAHQDVPLDSNSSCNHYSVVGDGITAPTQNQSSPLPSLNARGATSSRESDVDFYANSDGSIHAATSDQKTAQTGIGSHDRTTALYEVVDYTRDRKLSAK